MKILAVGGGSGGHVTPTVAVLREVKKQQKNAEIRFWCDRKFARQAREIVATFDENVPVQIIAAGKLRRYHHLSIARQLLWPSLVMKNLGDSFLVLLGFLQSLVKLIIWRPDVVFTKGGYVCLPVGLAAHILRIPLVIHDSDAHPGLTNRVLSRWASAIATGAPLEYYSYPAEKSYYIGIPIAAEFHKFSEAERLEAKKEWGIDPSLPLLVVTGGGLGAKRINDTVALKLDELLKITSVVLISGAGQYDELTSLVPPNSGHFQLHSFISRDMAKLLGAADLVVTRAGATTILELATLAKPTILIPNAKLTGGHQVKNAAVYEKAGATIVINEEAMMEKPQILVDAVKKVLENKDETIEMAKRFETFARPNAAEEMAKLVISRAR